jgi:SAM-dependent methyltransferase
MTEYEHWGVTEGPSYKVRQGCRLCDGTGLNQLLRLKPTPPANELLEDCQASEKQERFPLGLWQCQTCWHVQLPIVIDPDRLFRIYPYVSGTSPVFVDHLSHYVDTVLKKFGMKPGHFVVEIGSNDGTLLRFFQEAGMKVIGVDPARNVAEQAVASGVETIPEFIDIGLAKEIVRNGGKASVVIANNVFAHSDDLEGMALAAREMLHHFGVFIFEVQYLVDLCDKALFDMVYHEHLSYHHLGPLGQFFDRLGMRIFDVERVSVHGGSIRCYVDFGKRPVSEMVSRVLEVERTKGLLSNGPEPNSVLELGSKVEEVRKSLTERIRKIIGSGGRIIGYGAPAKACTLSHHFGLGRSVIDFIVDDNPLKQGKFLPGLGIPIKSPSALSEIVSPEGSFLLMLAWNYANDIMKKPVCTEFKERGGKFIVPFPVLREA